MLASLSTPGRRAVRAFTCLSLLMAAIASRAGAQAGASGDVFILVTGNDTIAVERFTRTASRLDVELLVRPASARLRFSVDLAPDGGATRLVNAYWPATADTSTAPLQRAEVRFTRDSALAELTGGGRTSTQRFATRPGVVPFQNPSMALMELTLRRARMIGGDSVAVPIWNVQGGATIDAIVVRQGDSAVVRIAGLPLRLAVNAAGDILGGAVPSQNLRVVRVRGSDPRARTALAAEKPDYTAPAGAPYTAEAVTVPTPDGHTLAGTLTIPKGTTGGVPAIVTITGSGPEDRDEAIPPVKGYRPFRQIADTLARHGIAVLRMDDRGWGESTGNHESATSQDFANDIRAGLAYLRRRPEIDATRLGLVGHSEGGLIAPMVAADDSTLRAIVLMAGPAQRGRTILRYQLRNAIERDTSLGTVKRDSALGSVDRMIDSLGAAQPWMRFFLDYDPLATARRVQVPTLILQGATDRQVTAEQAEALAKALRDGGNRDVTVRVFPSANHLFVEDADGSPAGYTALPSPLVRGDVLGAIADWLRAKLRVAH